MNFWFCKLVNLSNQKSSSSIYCNEGAKMLLLFYCAEFDELGKSLELLPPDVRFLS